MTVRGWTSVDSYYEYLGFVAQQGIFSVLEQARVFWIVVACGLIGAILRLARGRDEPAALLFYLGQLILLGVLLAPAASSVAPPGGAAQPVYGSRAALVANAVADGLQRRAIERIDDEFARAPFAYERLMALLAQARFHDAFLAQLLREFADQCGRPVFARRGADGVADMIEGTAERAIEGARQVRDSLLELWDEVGGAGEDWMVLSGRRESCARVRQLLGREIRENLSRNQMYREAAELYRELTGAAPGSGLEQAFVRRAIDNEIAGSVTETARVREVLPENLVMHRAESDQPGLGLLARGWDAVAGTAAEAAMWIREGSRAKYAYAMLLASAPHVYGMTAMTLLALFPVVGAWALLPGRWRILITYLQVFLSVKAWPVLWAMYSAFHRGVLASPRVRVGELDGWEGPGVIALLAFYFATPVLSLTVAMMLGRAAQAAVLSRFAQAPADVSEKVVAGGTRMLT